MTSFAKRRKRRRRLTAAAFSLTAAVLAVVFGLLWRQTVFHKRHAEAHQLIALGSNHLKTSSTAALAHATKSMELMDSIEARILALKALWEGPTAFIVNEDPTQHSSFSRGGKWLVQNHRFSKTMTIVSSDGLQRQVSHPQESGGIRLGAFFGGPEDVFFSWGNDRGNAELWSAASARPLASAGPLDNPGVAFSRGALGGDSDNPRAIWTMVEGGLITVLALTPDGGQERLGAIQLENSYGHIESVCAPRVSANWLAVVDGHEISIVMVEDNGLSKRTRLGRHEGELLSGCEADPFGRFFVTANRSDDLKLWGLSGHLTSNDIDGPHRLLWYDIAQYGSTVVAVTESRDSKEKQAWIWSIDGDRFRAIRQFPLASFRGSPAIDPNGHWLAHPGPISASSLWSCGSPAGSEPILLRIGQTSHSYSLQFSPDGRWIAVSDLTGLSLWPLSRPFPAVMRLDYEEGVGSVAFGPEGEFVVISAGGVVSLIPLDGSGAAVGRTAMKAGRGSLDVEVSPDGEVIASCNTLGEIWIWRDGGEEPTLLPGPKEPGGGLIAFSPEANFVAALCGSYPRDETEYRVWSVPDAREVAVLRLDGDEFRGGSLFTDDGRLITGTSRGVVAWNVEEGDGEVLVEANVFHMAASGDGQRLLMTEEAEEGFLEGPVGYPVFLDLETGGSTTLITHGSRVRSLAVDRDGTLAVTGDPDGVIRVGPVTGEEPHLLLGHEGHVGSLTIDPLGRWIASAGQDNTIRLWPMPDLSKPPLHTLPRDELIAKLKTLTNLQVVRDEQSPSGWKIEVGPFPGWETVPTW
jgi:WD40 repeat protein